MEIWLIIDGEKAGPFHDFDIRSKIECGELPPETPAWHEGLATWRPLVLVPLFATVFDSIDRQTPGEQSAAEDDAPRRRPPPLPVKPVVVRRFWARWLDLQVYLGFWWLGMWLTGRNIGDILENPWIMLFQLVPWFVVETLLIHHLGTTPGKWLLGLRVLNDDDSLLTLRQAVTRSTRVLCLGVGFGWSLISIVCQVMALVTTQRLGRPLWDHAAGHKVTSKPLHPVGISSCVIAFFAAIQLQFAVIGPYAMEEASKMVPQLRESFEKNPPWHLPKH